VLLSYELSEGVATITLRRVEARNALDMSLKGELAEAVERAGSDAGVRSVILTGEGGAFCAGGDIEEMVLNDTPVTSRARLRKLLADIFIPLHEMEKPTVAAVNGHAHGAGLSLAMACDLIVASEDAVMSCAFTKVGLVPDCGALYFLPRRVTMGVAKDLIFTGRRIKAAEALELGMVNRVVPAGALMEQARALAADLAAGPTVVYGMTKTLLSRSSHLGLRDLAELEAFGQAVAYSTEDHLSARGAFSSKTAPTFVGR
jgi:2-(1,2-epoxy-1,2-dihydrophenyl)acetyl-CoA isomerase